MANVNQFLSDQLAFFGRQARSAEAWKGEHDAAMICRDVEDAVAIAVQLVERIDRMAECDPRLRAGKWDEVAAKSYVPWYQRWYEHAGEIVAAVKRLKKQGYIVVGTDRFMKAYLRAKLFAVDFDKTLEAMKRVAAGQTSGVALERVLDELQGRA